jgi:hypothetical protein
MADDAKGTYDLVPEGEPEDESTGESASEHTGEPTGAAPSVEQSTDAVAPGVPTEPLLDAFDDDEDLERDPEVEEALSGKRNGKKARHDEPAEADTRKELVKPGWDPPRAMFVTGGILTTAAIITTAVYTPDHRFLAPLLVLYKIAVHTGTGVVAVIAASLLLHLKTGRLDKAASRMFVAVSAFMLVVHFDLGLGKLSSTVELLLGSLAYLIVIAWLFRLRRDRLLVVTISHLALVAIMELGMVLSTMMVG